MKPFVSVVVPFYNEEASVPLLWARITAVFAELPGYYLEGLLVNDGSTDGTRAAIDQVAAADPRVHPVHLAGNHGQSAALYAGMVRARGEYLLTLDGDLQNDPADFPRFLELLGEYDCVCGYRAHRHDSAMRRISSKIANTVRNWILHDGVRDAGCGAKGFRPCCLPHFVCFNGLHRFFPVFVRQGGLTLVETPVNHHPRQHGVSKYGIGNRLWRGLFDLVGVAWLRRRHVVLHVEER